MSEIGSGEKNRTFNFRRYIPGELNVRIDGYTMRKDNRKGNEGEWLYSYGRPDRSGHFYVDYLGSKYYIHKMVAELFVDIPSELVARDDLVVHHKDEDKLNNSLGNLESMSTGDHFLHHRREIAAKKRKVRLNKEYDESLSQLVG